MLPVAGACLAIGLVGCTPGGTQPAGDTSGGASTVVAVASPEAAAPPRRVDLAAVATVLRSRAAALAAGDAQAYAASIADRSSDRGRLQLDSYRAARALGVSRVAVGDLAVEPPPPGTSGTAGTMRVRAALAYRLAGLDRVDRTTSVLVELRRGPGGWAVASEAADAAGAPPWVVMPDLRVVRGRHAVVAGTVADSRLAQQVRVVDRALPRLRRLWARAPQHVLVLAPGTDAEADALLGRAPGTGGAPVAATTEGPPGHDGRAAADRVVLDPTAGSRLTAAGRDVVLTHELTHVAVRATVAGHPAAWLSEGYADHVGYERADVPVVRLLEPLLREVRTGRTPTALPHAADLDPRSGAIEVPYLGAWQAVELLADEYGEDALRRLVVAASVTGSDAQAEAATDRALREVLGTSRAELTTRWQRRLDALTE